MNWRPCKPAVRPAAALGLGLLLAALAFGGCASRPRPAEPDAPPAGYQRRIVVLVERADFQPVAGAQVRIEVEAPTQLISPAGGVGRTDGRGALELVFEPRPQYDRGALTGGDIIADFPIRAVLTIGRAGGAPVKRVIEDRQTFARYADPLYQGLNRDPETEATYFGLTMP